MARSPSTSCGARLSPATPTSMTLWPVAESISRSRCRRTPPPGTRPSTPPARPWPPLPPPPWTALRRFTLPSYTPAEYPAFDAIGTAMSTLPSSPVASDLAANAAGVQAAWESPEVLEEFEKKNLVPLIPMLAAGGYSTMCSKPMTSLEDWKGKQLRVGSAAAGKQVTDLGATPVSLSFPETYEALQRGTVDCDLGQLAPNVEAGTFEVAPNIGVASDAGIARSA